MGRSQSEAPKQNTTKSKRTGGVAEVVSPVLQVQSPKFNPQYHGREGGYIQKQQVKVARQEHRTGDPRSPEV
jgi:hypothetical protein